MESILSYVLAWLASLLIFLGLPLLGWGLRDVPHFFDNPARIAYTIVILALQAFAVWYNPQVGRNKENRQSGLQRHRVDLILIQVFSLAVVFLGPFSDRRGVAVLDTSNVVRYLGFILLIPGFLIMQVAEKQLDKQFSIEVTLQQDHKLIQHGLYRSIRHPRYLGILLFFMGISIVFRSWLAMLLVVALCLVLIWRMHAEEALMQQEFGAEWEAYRAKSWRMIPFVF